MALRIGRVVAVISFLCFFPFSTASGEVLTLREGLKLATENSRLVKISQGDEKVSEADTLIERSRFLPKVTAGAEGAALAYQPGAIFGDLSVPTSERRYYAYNVNIEQTLYDFGKNASRYESSKMRLEAKKIETQRSRNMAAIQFALAYFDLLESEKMVLVSQQEVERLESHLRDARNLFDEGVITKNDLLQAEVKLSDSRQRLLTAKNDREVKASRLNNALVRPLKTRVEVMDVEGPLLQTLAVTDDLEKAWEIAEKERPEIQVVDYTLKSLDLDEQAKKAEYYPKIFATGSYDFMENRYQLHEGNFALTLGMGIDLYSGGKTRAEVAKIVHEREKLVEERNKLVDEVKLEAEQYILDARTARERVAVTKDAVEQAEENVRINRVRYTEGVGTATDVLDAVTLLTVAETNHYRAVYDFSRAEAAALYAVGTDLTEVYK